MLLINSVLLVLEPLPDFVIKITAPKSLTELESNFISGNSICWNGDGNLVFAQDGKVRILNGGTLETITSENVEGNVLSIAAYESGYVLLLFLNNKASIKLYNSELRFRGVLLDESVSEKCCITTRHSSGQILVMSTDYQMKSYNQEGELQQSAKISYEHTRSYDNHETEHVYICALDSEVLVSISDRNLVKKIRLQGCLDGKEKILWECGDVIRPTTICSDAAGYVYVVSDQPNISVLGGATGKLYD